MAGCRPTTLVIAIMLLAAPASAEKSRPAVFAVIVGVNRSVDEELQPLRYADDDAARYFDLFRSLGARTYLLTRPDANTRRLHPQAAAEARHPVAKQWDDTLVLLHEDIRQARNRGVTPVLYFVYAGHGNIEDGRGYITLEDSRLTGKELEEHIVEGPGAQRIHLIVDACYSYLLVSARGPGGRRRPVHGFSAVRDILRHGNVGVLLSTSSARESHEWEAFQAGVFSHEVRSGLYGAADVDRDGQVSYREIAAFVDRANVAIPNERFRPRVFARPPETSGTLLDLRGGLERSLEVDGDHHGRFMLEDTQGVRLADFHSAPGHAVHILRPAAYGSLYLHLPGTSEFVLADTAGTIRLSQLSPALPRVQERGAAHHAFEKLFEKPFGSEDVTSYSFPPLDELIEIRAPFDPGIPAWRRAAGYSALALGAAAAMSGVLLTREARTLHNQVSPSATNQEAGRVNDRIDRYNTGAVVLYSLAGAAVATGLVMLLWPEDPPEAGVVVSGEGAFFTVGGSF